MEIGLTHHDVSLVHRNTNYERKLYKATTARQLLRYRRVKMKDYFQAK